MISKTFTYLSFSVLPPLPPGLLLPLLQDLMAVVSSPDLEERLLLPLPLLLPLTAGLTVLLLPLPLAAGPKEVLLLPLAAGSEVLLLPIAADSEVLLPLPPPSGMVPTVTVLTLPSLSSIFN